jgi:hypothetical protein
VLEWVFRDALGNDIPCEVRWVRLQSGEHRLIRGSITDITERKRAELLAAGERRVFERLAANVDLRITLEAITDVTERVAPDTVCALRLLDETGTRLNLCAGPRLPVDYARASETIPVAVRNGSCAAAVYLQRQVIVADIARDALWENMRDVVLAAGLAQLLVDADSRVRWAASSARSRFTSELRAAPLRRDFELMARMTQLAGIAIERRTSGRCVACQRSALSPPVRQRDGRRLQLDARWAASCRSIRRWRAWSVSIPLPSCSRRRLRRSITIRWSASRSSRRSSAMARSATPSSNCSAWTARR